MVITTVPKKKATDQNSVYLGASKINLQIKHTSHLRYTCKNTDILITCFKFMGSALI